jgi:hypothetical protein
VTPDDDDALIHIRQSRNKRYERTVSPETQEAACRALPAVKRCGSVGVYRDLDLSGKSVAHRPEFRAFLRRLQERPPKVVAAYDQSRSFRNTTEALDFFALMERLPERERLEQLLRELRAVVAEKPVAWAPLGSLIEGWRTGDPRTRRELLGEFFEELNVEDGRVASVVPRRDRAVQVANLIERAFAKYRRCSPGGIRGDVQSSPQIPVLRFG